MPSEPIIKRDGRYFCPECGHMMQSRMPSCSMCSTVFDGMVEEQKHDAEHPPTVEEMHLVEEIEERESRWHIWTAVSVFLVIVITALVLFLVCH